MDHETPQSWRTIRRERPLNDKTMATYERLMDAEVRLDEVRRRRGVSDTALGDALEASESGDVRADREEYVYLSTLAR
jgi:hypothetical protein